MEDNFDRLHAKCEKCFEGTYEEKTLQDSWTGDLTCNKCSDRNPRYFEHPLKIWGWLPGGYVFTCLRCKVKMCSGAKRCLNCEACAIERKMIYEENSKIAEVLELRSENAKLRKVLSDIREHLSVDKMNEIFSEKGLTGF